MNQNPHNFPDQKAFECLEYLLQHRVYVRSLPGPSGCTTHTLRKLESMGLVEQVHDIRLPLEVPRVYYRMTIAGQRALESHSGDQRGAKNWR